MNRRRRQWCYWLSLGALTLLFCVQWMRDNRQNDEDPGFEQRHAKVKSLYIRASKSKRYVQRDRPKSVPDRKNATQQKTKLSIDTVGRPTAKPRTPGRIDSNLSGRYKNGDIQANVRRVIIIMTQTGSDRSFLKSVFPTNSESIFLDEPLLPFGLNCDTLIERKARFLGQFLSCNFSNLPSRYADGFNVSGAEDSGAKCIENGLCFTDKELLREYTKLCHGLLNASDVSKDSQNSSTCGFPLKETILHQQCMNANIVFTKVTRICSLHQMQKVYDFLKSTGREPYIFHLVSDPRLMIADRAKNSSVAEWQAMCKRMQRNLAIPDKTFPGGKVPRLVTDGRYMIMRMEDLMSDITWVKKVYRFIGMHDLPAEVEKSIQALSTQDDIERSRMRKKKVSKINNPIDQMQAFLNDALHPRQALLHNWRKAISFDTVSTVQNTCGEVMKVLGYTLFKTEQELRNTSIPFFE